MDDVIEASIDNTRFTMLVLSGFAVASLVLAGVGLYGTLSYVVAQRTREIGVRMALGATASAVRAQVVAQGAKVVIVGAVIGIAAAYFTTKFLARLLFDVKPVDPLTYATVALLLMTATRLASYIPARRASNLNPVAALRAD